MMQIPCLYRDMGTYASPSASKSIKKCTLLLRETFKKLPETLGFNAVFFQCCVQLFKRCVHFSKLRATSKSGSHFSKGAFTFKKLRQLFKNQ